MTLLFIHWCITNQPKTLQSEIMNICYLIYYGSGIWAVPHWVSLSGFPTRPQIEMSAGAEKAQLGRNLPRSYVMAVSTIQVLAGCWTGSLRFQKEVGWRPPSVLWPVGLSNMVPTLLQCTSQGSEGEACLIHYSIRGAVGRGLMRVSRCWWDPSPNKYPDSWHHHEKEFRMNQTEMKGKKLLLQGKRTHPRVGARAYTGEWAMHNGVWVSNCMGSSHGEME